MLATLVIGIVVFAVVCVVLWNHSRECGEVSIGLLSENRWVAGVGAIALVYCMYDGVEMATVGAYVVPAAMLEKHCTDVQNKMLLDLTGELNNPALQQDQAAIDACSAAMQAVGKTGAEILSH